MKKWLAVTALSLAVLFVSKNARADGNYLPVLVVSSVTGQGYAYPNSASSSTPGSVLVNNGGGAFNWSSAAITSTTSLTVFQLPALPTLTLAQLTALTPATTGQIAVCTNCTQSVVCVATGTASGTQWAVVSGTTATGGLFGVCR